MAQQDPPEGTYRLTKPEFEGVECEVQHPADHPAGATRQLGKIGVAVVPHPTEGYRIAFNVLHPDGTQLSALLDMPAYLCLTSCIEGAGRTVLRLSGFADTEH